MNSTQKAVVKEWKVANDAPHLAVETSKSGSHVKMSQMLANQGSLRMAALKMTS